MSRPSYLPPISVDIKAANSNADVKMVKFTESGSFAVGDFFKMNESGFQFSPSSQSSSTSKTLKRALSSRAQDQTTPTHKRKRTATPSTCNALFGPSSPFAAAVSPGSPRRVTFEASASPFDDPADPADPSAASGQYSQEHKVNETLSFCSLTPGEIDILGTLGQGSSSVVQRVRHIPDDRILALKVIPVDWSEKKVMRLVTELQTLVACDCPYIVSFAGAFYKERTMSIALEYMDMGSLADVYKLCHHQNVPLEERFLACMSRQVLRGLNYLHKQTRVIHRDIKPSNILLNRAGEVKIADFGVTSGELNDSFDGKTTFLGTVTYMSPERIQCKNHSFDSDIWSFGLTMIECALGHFPYKSKSQENRYGYWDIMDKIVAGSPPVLPQSEDASSGPDDSASSSATPCNSAWSSLFASFLEDCLQKEPSKRATAKQLLKHPWLQQFEGASSAAGGSEGTLADEKADLAEWLTKLHALKKNAAKRPGSTLDSQALHKKQKVSTCAARPSPTRKVSVSPAFLAQAKKKHGSDLRHTSTSTSVEPAVSSHAKGVSSHFFAAATRSFCPVVEQQRKVSPSMFAHINVDAPLKDSSSPSP